MKEENSLSVESVVVDPYSTSFGELITIDKTKKELMNYIIMAEGSLSYEYVPNEATRLVFITGKNQEEKDLPVWDHTLVYEDGRGNQVVASDLRKYLKVLPENVMNIEEYNKDKAGYDFTILRALITYEFASGNYGRFRNLEKTVITSYSSWYLMY